MSERKEHRACCYVLPVRIAVIIEVEESALDSESERCERATLLAAHIFSESQRLPDELLLLTLMNRIIQF